MVVRTFSQADIEALIPHRYENVLVDEVQMRNDNGEIKARLSLSISASDPLGRNLFFTQHPPQTLLTSFTMEILALGSIVCSDKLIPGYPVFFTTISNFK